MAIHPSTDGETATTGSPTEASSRTDDSGDITIATWNIRNGRNGGIESACRALDKSGINIAVFQETKLTNDVYTRSSSGYRIVASNAPSAHQGGIALVWQEHQAYELEEYKFYGGNVMTFRLITEAENYYIIGCYIPPGCNETLALIMDAYNACPSGFKVLLLGDLNINLDTPRDTREETIAEQLDFWNLGCLSTQFTQRYHKYNKRWTWYQWRQGRLYSTKPDYFLSEPGIRFRNVSLRKLRHHATDHRAIVGRLRGGSKKRLDTYRRKVGRCPFQLPCTSPHSLQETLFQQLKACIEKKAARASPRNQWISQDTWTLVDRRAQLRSRGSLNQSSNRRLSRQINASFARDRQQRAENDAAEIDRLLGEGDLKEAWGVVKKWYRSASDRGPTPCRETMAKQTQERIDLYRKRPPPGEAIPIIVRKARVEDDTPLDQELRDIVKNNLNNGRAGGASFIRAEDIKAWLRGIIDEEDILSPAGPEAGRNWRLFVQLIQVIWETGIVPQSMMWIIVVLIPKGNGDFRGIGLLEPIWKVIEMVMDTRLNVIKFHDCLHGFVKKRGCGTATLEAKLVQQLCFIRQTPLFTEFLDLRKAYDAMDRERCLEILEGYGVGPKMLRLIKFFWDYAELVCRASGRYGEIFRAGRGVTQGGPLSPKIFNIMVDAIVREWLRAMDLEDAMPEKTVGSVITVFIALFYADDGMIASTDADLLQKAMDCLAALFERTGLFTNVDKTKAMPMVNTRVRTRLTESSYRNRYSGLHTPEQWASRRVQCDHCEKSLSASSLRSHLESQHDVYQSRSVLRELMEERAPRTYHAERSMDGHWQCPVPGCCGGVAASISEKKQPWQMRKHFIDRHPNELVVCIGEGDSATPYPRCPECRMQTNPVVLNSIPRYRRHLNTDNCKNLVASGAQRASALKAAAAVERTREFTIYDDRLESVETFKYLGRLLAMDDNDMPAVRANIQKSRKVWKRLGILLRSKSEGTIAPRVKGMFYKAVVQSVLLFGSETWALTETSLRVLEGFHVRSAYRMATVHCPRKLNSSTWSYPKTEDVFEEVGLKTIREYIEVRRNTIAAGIINRPILKLCVDQETVRGTVRRLWWWEQSMDIDLASVRGNDLADVAGHDIDLGVYAAVEVV